MGTRITAAGNTHTTHSVQAPSEEDCTGTHTAPQTNWTQCPPTHPYSLPLAQTATPDQL
jgi:hypothetical protein